MSIKQLYAEYRNELARTDGQRHGAILRELTEREQQLFDAWQTAIRECNTWTDGEYTWHILDRYQDVDLEMWTCRIVSPDGTERTSDCYAAYIRQMARPVDE